MATKWGIASAGKISHDFVLALSTLPLEEHEVVAVAARDLSRAKEFSSRHNISTSYGSYLELARDPNVEVVYIGSINTEHLCLGKLFLEHGKHVLCEKPLCMNKKEAEELVKLARKKKLFLMEAIWSRFFPTYEYVKKEITLGSLGEVLQVQASFGVMINDVDRVTKKELGGSATLDIGIYTIQFAFFVFGKPTSIKATGFVNAEGVDTNVSVILTYPGNKIATLTCDSRVNLRNEAVVVGTKGSLLVKDFWCPLQVVGPGNNSFDATLPEVTQKFFFKNSAGLRYEAMEVRRCLQQGLTECPHLTLQDSLDIAEVEDEIRRQIGAYY